MLLTVLNILTAFLVLFSAALCLLGAWGLVKIPDTLSRLHAPSMMSSLGMASMIAAAIVQLIAQYLHAAGAFPIANAFALVLVGFAITAPIGTHWLARAALRMASDKE